MSSINQCQGRVPGDSPDNIDTVVDTIEVSGDTDLWCETRDLTWFTFQNYSHHFCIKFLTSPSLSAPEHTEHSLYFSSTPIFDKVFNRIIEANLTLQNLTF